MHPAMHPATQSPTATPAEACAAFDREPGTAAPQLRPVAPSDLPAMRAFVQALSPSSRRLRFHGGLKPDSDRLLRHLTGTDGARHVAFVAVLACDDGDVIVGEARWVRTGGAAAEFAVVVADAWQGRGLARALLERLLQAAAKAGIETLTADVLDDNARMAAFLQRHGFRTAAAGSDAAGGVQSWVHLLAQRPPARPAARRAKPSMFDGLAHALRSAFGLAAPLAA